MAKISSPRRTTSTASPPLCPRSWPPSGSSVRETPCARSGPESCCSPLMPVPLLIGSYPTSFDLPRRRRQSGAVNVIAVHYTPGGGEALAGALAEALDKTPYEARARLSDPEGGPAVVARYGEIEPAWACTGRL